MLRTEIKDDSVVGISESMLADSSIAILQGTIAT
jgi:hypothetical protein